MEAFSIVQRIGYDMITTDDVPGFNVSKNPVLYKIDDAGSNMFFSFSGDHPTWSVDGVAWSTFYAGATDRKVYVCNYLKEQAIIPEEQSNTIRLNQFSYVEEEGTGRLDISWMLFGATASGAYAVFHGSNSQLTLSNVNDPSDTLTFTELLNRVETRPSSLAAYRAGDNFGILRFGSNDLYVGARGYDEYNSVSASFVWKLAGGS
jgi:hypothetical protein